MTEIRDVSERGYHTSNATKRKARGPQTRHYFLPKPPFQRESSEAAGTERYLVSRERCARYNKMSYKGGTFVSIFAGKAVDEHRFLYLAIASLHSLFGDCFLHYLSGDCFLHSLFSDCFIHSLSSDCLLIMLL